MYHQSIGTVTVSSISFTSETWYHLAFVWTKSSENLRVLRYDVDLNAQSTNVNLASLSFNPFQPRGTFFLGSYNSLPGNPEKLHWEFIGCLDDLRIWDTGVSDSDVSSRWVMFPVKTHNRLKEKRKKKNERRFNGTVQNNRVPG